MRLLLQWLHPDTMNRFGLFECENREREKNLPRHCPCFWAPHYSPFTLKHFSSGAVCVHHLQIYKYDPNMHQVCYGTVRRAGWKIDDLRVGGFDPWSYCLYVRCLWERRWTLISTKALLAIEKVPGKAKNNCSQLKTKRISKKYTLIPLLGVLAPQQLKILLFSHAGWEEGLFLHIFTFCGTNVNRA